MAPPMLFLMCISVNINRLGVLIKIKNYIFGARLKRDFLSIKLYNHSTILDPAYPVHLVNN